MYLKPKYFASLNRNHRHAKDMAFCLLMNENTGLQTWDFIGRNSYEFDGTYTPDWGAGGVEFNANREHINGPVLNTVLTGGSGNEGTVLFKWKNTNTPSGYLYFFTAGDTYDIFSMMSYTTYTRINIYWGSGASVSFNPVPDIRDYEVLAITFISAGASSTVSLYLDGNYIGTETMGVNFPDSSELLNIGGRNDSDGRYAGGIIESFYIWDKALSDTEVFQVSNNPYAMFEDTEVVPVLYTAAGGEISIPVAMHHYTKNTGAR